MFLKKTFGLGAALVVCAAGCAFALTDAEYKTLMKNDEFKAADAQLNTAWKLAKSRLTPAEFEKLKAEQKKWIARGRDAAAQRSIKESETPKAEAYAMVTEERAAEITKSANVSYLKRNPNWVQGYYVRDDKNEPGTLQVFWDGSGAKTVRVNLNVVLDLGGDNIREGNLNGAGLPTWAVTYDTSNVKYLSNQVAEMVAKSDGMVLFGDNFLSADDANTYLDYIAQIFAGDITPEEFAKGLANDIGKK